MNQTEPNEIHLRDQLCDRIEWLRDHGLGGSPEEELLRGAVQLIDCLVRTTSDLLATNLLMRRIFEDEEREDLEAIEIEDCAGQGPH